MKAKECVSRPCLSVAADVQHWAKQRGIYSSVMGFLGGGSLALLATRIRLHFPNACAATIVRNFFRFLDVWDWSLPVMVSGIDTGGPFRDMVWDRTDALLSGHDKLPILNPCYPATNAARSASVSATHRIPTSSLC